MNAGAGGDATTIVRRADHANALGRHDEALRLASQVLAGDPTHLGASVAAGIALLNTGRVSQGIEMLRAAVAAHPDSAEALRLLSFGYVRSGQSTWALRSAHAAVALEPREPMARCQLSHALVASGDRLAAIHEGERAVELAPHLAQTHLALAEALHPQGAAADKYVDRAEQHVRRALELEPDNALAHNELARIAIARGRFYRAAGYLANGVAVDPGQHVLHVNMNVVFGLAVRQAHFSILGACLVIVLWSLSPWPRWVVSVLSVLTVAVALGWVWWRLRRAVPRHLLAFLRGFAKRDRLGLAWAGVVVAVALILATVAVLSPTHVASAASGVLRLLLIGSLISWVRVRASR